MRFRAAPQEISCTLYISKKKLNVQDINNTARWVIWRLRMRLPEALSFLFHLTVSGQNLFFKTSTSDKKNESF